MDWNSNLAAALIQAAATIFAVVFAAWLSLRIAGRDTKVRIALSRAAMNRDIGRRLIDAAEEVEDALTGIRLTLEYATAHLLDAPAGTLSAWHQGDADRLQPAIAALDRAHDHWRYDVLRPDVATGPGIGVAHVVTQLSASASLANSLSSVACRTQSISNADDAIDAIHDACSRVRDLRQAVTMTVEFHEMHAARGSLLNERRWGMLRQT